MAKTHLYLIRHCQSMGNLKDILQGVTEMDVSPMGEKQLALLSLRFRNVPLDAVYSSPLIRARKTADAVNTYHHLPVRELDDLKEIDVGVLEGESVARLYSEHPAVADKWANDPANLAFPGGECMADVFRRAQRALHTILSESAGKNVAVASHGCLLQNMAAALLYGELSGVERVKVSGNTSVSEFFVAEDGTVELVRLNDISHLPPELTGNLKQFDLKEGRG